VKGSPVLSMLSWLARGRTGFGLGTRDVVVGMLWAVGAYVQDAQPLVQSVDPLSGLLLPQLYTDIGGAAGCCEPKHSLCIHTSFWVYYTGGRWTTAGQYFSMVLAVCFRLVAGARVLALS
jgi:hypothetical protein